jgi:hypothetical protein
VGGIDAPIGQRGVEGQRVAAQTRAGDADIGPSALNWGV